MKSNLEIEFKCLITKEKYDELINVLELQSNIFTQTNHYFDSQNHDILNSDIVLRIRHKNNYYKLTSKGHLDPGAFETHIFLTEDEALNMIESGFDASIIGLNYNVKKICELTTYRVSTPYKNGTLFIDKNFYYDKIDYEIEFEVDSFEQGEIEFNALLSEFNIPYEKSISKSKRAFCSCNK